MDAQICLFLCVTSESGCWFTTKDITPWVLGIRFLKFFCWGCDFGWRGGFLLQFFFWWNRRRKVRITEVLNFVVPVLILDSPIQAFLKMGILMLLGQTFDKGPFNIFLVIPTIPCAWIIVFQDKLWTLFFGIQTLWDDYPRYDPNVNPKPWDVILGSHQNSCNIHFGLLLSFIIKKHINFH